MRQMGKLMEDIAEELFPSLDEETRSRILKECCEYENEYLAKTGGVLYDGVEDVFKELSSKYSVCIVSNCQAGYIETFLEYYDFGKYITDIEDAGHTGLTKAGNIKLVMERNHFDKAFYVGDILGDMKSSDEAGSEFIHAAYGFGTVPKDRPAIASIKELPDKIIELLEKDA
jgi:phosphoglycolate phosphatase